MFRGIIMTFSYMIGEFLTLFAIGFFSAFILGIIWDFLKSVFPPLNKDFSSPHDDDNFALLIALAKAEPNEEDLIFLGYDKALALKRELITLDFSEPPLPSQRRAIYQKYYSENASFYDDIHKGPVR